MAQVTLSTRLACAPDQAWARVRTSALLLHVSAPLIRLTPKGKAPFPQDWQPGEYRAWLWLFGLVPLGWQAVVLSEPPPQGAERYIRDDGYSPLIRRWDHWITIAPAEGGTTLYTDRVMIEAGLLTPLIAVFARALYAHRQRRWQELARTGFAALDD